MKTETGERGGGGDLNRNAKGTHTRSCHTDGEPNSSSLIIQKPARVCCKGHIHVHFPRGVRQAEGISSAEAIACDPYTRRPRRSPQVVDGGVKDGLDYLWTVRGDKRCAVKVGVVEVRWRGCAVEKIRSDGEKAGAGEGVNKAGISVSVSLE